VAIASALQARWNKVATKTDTPSRNSPGVAKAIAERLLPYPTVRKIICSDLATYWRYANAKFKGKVFITLGKRYIRLNVGMVEVFVITADHVLVVCDEKTGRSDRPGPYRSEPDAWPLRLLHDGYIKKRRRLQPVILSVIDKLGRTRKNPSTSKAHSPGLIQFLESTYPPQSEAARPGKAEEAVLHILVGDRKDPTKLSEAARKRRSVPWIVPKTARQGEKVLFFLPEIGIAAIGSIAKLDKTPGRFGARPAYGARVGDLQLLNHPVPLDALARITGWKWPSYPRSYTTVRGEIAARLIDLVETYGNERDGGENRRASVSAMEGIRKEYRRISRSRNRPLRKSVLDREKGVCQACKQDFSRILDGLGLRALHVHHREQLAASDAPPITHPSQLAVVCANCHALIHSNPRRALPVEELQKRLVGQ
jgi:5-methylcytosine-specific restriction endonuclease McrA